ncbi:MAG: family 20 glycosylhydrolase [Calditrichaeota bacterium]|nr:family 20 glycosylhydrolase [Calditrichota bacterium]
MRHIHFSWIILLAFSISSSGWTQTKNLSKGPAVLPVPQEWQYGSGRFSIDSTLVLVLDSQSLRPSDTAVRLLKQTLQSELKISPPIVQSLSSRQKGIILMKVDSPGAKNWLKQHQVSFLPKMEPEGYILSIDPRQIVIIGKTDPGLFYGVVTLIQLVRESNNGTLQAIQIRDWPALKFRGISDDMARGQVPTLKEMKKIIRFSAFYKMNTYMPYLEDLFTSKKYPSIGKNRGRLTPKEVRDLQDYAQKYYVQVIPIFELLGHCENILIQPKFEHLAEFPGAASLSTTNPKTYTFLRNIIREQASLWKSPYFHAGLDESWDVGKGESKPLVERYNTAVVHAEHYNKLYQMLKKQGKTMIMYGDIILRNPEILTQLPKDILIMDWHYHASDDFPSVEFFQRTGRKFLISPGVSDWRRIFPDVTKSLVNIKYYTQKGALYGALGSIVSTWGDYGGANFKELDWLGFGYAAACAWNPNGSDPEEFRQSFTRQFYGCTCPAIEAAYSLLAETASHIQYRDIWRHPFAPTSESSGALLQQSVACRNAATDVIKLIQKTRPVVQRNGSQLDYLDFAARLTGWYGRRLETVVWWNHVLHEYIFPEDRAKFKQEAVQRFRAMGAQIDTLAQTYRKLWLRNDKQANLHWILSQFDREKAFWNIKADEVSKGTYNASPALPSQFIYFPTAANDEATVPLSYFRKTFTLTRKPRKALLQVINAGVAENYFNGKKLGEMIARRTNSMTVISQHVKVYDLTKRVKQGKNLLAFQVKSYDPRGKAGINVYLWLLYPDGTSETILSDVYWKAADRTFKNWQKLNFDDSSWFNPIIRSSRRFIPRPYFKYNLPTWVD